MEARSELMAAAKPNRRGFLALVGASAIGVAHKCGLGAEPLRSRSVYPNLGETTSIAWSADGRVLAVALVSEIGLWDLREWRHLRWIATQAFPVRAFGKDAVAVRQMAFSPDGTRLATTGGMSGATRGIRIWSADEGRLLRHIVEPWEMRVADFASPLRFGPLEYSSDGSRIVSGLANGAVCVWNADDGSLVRRYGENQAEATSVPLDKWVAGVDAASAEAVIRALRGTDQHGNALAIPDHVTVFDLPEARFVRRVGFCAADGVVVGQLPDRIVAWDAASAAERYSWEGATAFAALPQGNGLAVWLANGVIEIVDCATDARRTLQAGTGLRRCHELAYVGDQALCCVGRSHDGRLIHRTLDVNSGAVEDAPLPWTRVGQIAISSDAHEVAAALFEGAEVAEIGSPP